jgi:beta-lactamase regulating signal transducer with metallopeptidase domain
VDLATTTENVDVAGTIGGVIGFVGQALLVIWILLVAGVAFLVYRKQSARNAARASRRPKDADQ